MPRTITARFPHHRQWCMIASVADSKSDLRARIRAARSQAVGAAAGAQERAGLLAAARAAGLLDRDGTPDEVGAVAIAAYIAAPGEPDVAAIRDAVREAGGVVLLPIPRADRTLDWALDDGNYRPEGRYPIEVPAGEVVGSGAAGLLAHGVRTVLVPALAVDMTRSPAGAGRGLLRPAPGRAGGHGGGSPGRAAVRLDPTRQRRTCESWRWCATSEVLPAGAVPREDHDQLMTAVLTPTRYVRAGPLSRAGARPVGQDAAGVDDVFEPEPESEPELEPDDDPEDPLVEDELPASEAFFDSALGVAGEVAEDLPRLSVR